MRQRQAGWAAWPLTGSAPSHHACVHAVRNVSRDRRSFGAVHHSLVSASRASRSRGGSSKNHRRGARAFAPSRTLFGGHLRGLLADFAWSDRRRLDAGCVTSERSARARPHPCDGGGKHLATPQHAVSSVRVSARLSARPRCARSMRTVRRELLTSVAGQIQSVAGWKWAQRETVEKAIRLGFGFGRRSRLEVARACWHLWRRLRTVLRVSAWD
jgi:hypothetical protein